MKRFLCLLILFVCIMSIIGCSKTEMNPVMLKSSMLTSDDRNNPQDKETYNQLIESSALYAYSYDKSGENIIQTIYIWNNLLRRELRLDLIQIRDAVPDVESNITIKFNEVMTIKNKTIDFAPTSSLSKNVLNLLLPKEFSINAKIFIRELTDMIIRLETFESYGDTEVITLDTIYQNNVLFDIEDAGSIHLVSSLDEVVIE